GESVYGHVDAFGWWRGAAFDSFEGVPEGRGVAAGPGPCEEPGHVADVAVPCGGGEVGVGGEVHVDVSPGEVADEDVAGDSEELPEHDFFLPDGSGGDASCSAGAEEFFDGVGQGGGHDRGV